VLADRGRFAHRAPPFRIEGEPQQLQAGRAGGTGEVAHEAPLDGDRMGERLAEVVHRTGGHAGRRDALEPVRAGGRGRPGRDRLRKLGPCPDAVGHRVESRVGGELGLPQGVAQPPEQPIGRARHHDRAVGSAEGLVRRGAGSGRAQPARERSCAQVSRDLVAEQREGAVDECGLQPLRARLAVAPRERGLDRGECPDRALTVALPVAVRAPTRWQAAGRLARARTFDLHHVGAEVGEHHAGQRARDVLAQVEDPQTVVRALHCHATPQVQDISPQVRALNNHLFVPIIVG
jgi:hypothetical protein